VNPVEIRIGIHRTARADERLWIGLERPPLGDGATSDFACLPDEPEFSLTSAGESEDEIVGAAGERLYAGLAEANDEIALALAQIIGVPDGDRRPLLVRIRAGAQAERIPWETLRLPDGTFLALDARWSLARVVDPRVPPSGPPPFSPPLRVAALLSAFGVPAAGEWGELRQAVDDSPVDVELLVFAGEPALEDQIRAAALPNVTVAGLPGNTELEQLQRQIADFRPHVLHFFCHGSSEDGPHLELATPGDFLAGFPQDPLILESRQIAAFSSSRERVWLAVLNCCEGAASRDKIHSLARDLIFESGFPAVVGMREPILSDDATSFSRSFYPALLAAVGEAVDQGSATLDWSVLLVGPRRALVERQGGPFTAAAARRREWTLPVLYLRPDDFTLVVPSPEQQVGVEDVPADAAGVLLEVLRAMRGGTGADAPPAYIADLDQRIARLEGHADSR
jgi:hypothetical protein